MLKTSGIRCPNRGFHTLTPSPVGLKINSCKLHTNFRFAQEIEEKKVHFKRPRGLDRKN
jgi:hypothetical protein